MLALDYSGGRSRRHPIMAAMTTATITPRMPVHPHLRFGIGVIRTRATIPPYLNARFRGDKLFSSQVRNLARAGSARKPLSGPPEYQFGLDPAGFGYQGCPSGQNALSGSVHARVRRLQAIDRE